MRPATADDLPGADELLARGWSDFSARMAQTARLEAREMEAKIAIAEGPRRGDFMGAISWHVGRHAIDTDERGGEVGEYNVEILSLGALSGRGAGSALIERVAEEAAREGVPLRLHAHQDAYGFYRRLGFSEDPPGSGFFVMDAAGARRLAARARIRRRPRFRVKRRRARR